MKPLLNKEMERASRSAIRLQAKFSPCVPCDSPLEPVAEAVKCASVGDSTWRSPACSSFDPFRNAQQSGEILWVLAKSIGWGVPVGDPNINDKTDDYLNMRPSRPEIYEFAPGFFEGKARSKKPTKTPQ